MKARAVSCEKCRKQIHEEEKQAFLKHEYSIASDILYSAVYFATASTLMSMEYKGRKPEYIKKLFEDLCFVYDTPDIFGKQIDLKTEIDRLEKKYGISFNDIHVNFEDEKHFIKSAKEKVK